MAILTQNLVHYTKFSLANWQGKKDRYKVNQTLRTTTNNNLLKFSWAFTRDSYELRNSLAGEDDCNWEGFTWAEQEWKDLRKQFKQDIVLWVAKACHQKHYVQGKVQPNIRVPNTVSLMYYLPKQDVLFQTVKMDQWTIEFQYNDTNNKIFNMNYDWRNPATSVQGGTAPGGW